jgi:predicted metal-dependent phosphoesterase TrpH
MKAAEEVQTIAINLLEVRERLEAQREIREWVVEDARRRLERVLELQEQFDGIRARLEQKFEELDEEDELLGDG